ncbi:MAG: type II toxin-antitoxin system Phd/YefM family antitoxin [Cyanobacteria bacterium P01_A01_bin.83]
MEIVNYSEARENFKQVLDRVSDDCDPTLIKRRDHGNVVLLSKSHFQVRKQKRRNNEETN